MRRSRTSVSGRPWLARRATRVGSTGLVGLIVVVSMLLGPAASGAWLQATPEASPVAGGADVPVVLFASDGMRPDLVTQYAGEGATPTFADLLATGVQGDNGLLQAFPPNTGTGWHTLATGTWPSEHGSTNNTFHRTGSADFAGTTASAYAPGILQADTIGQAAERAGKTVVAVEWVGARGYDPGLQGPVIDFREFLSDRGVLANYDVPGQPAGADTFGVTYQRVDLAPADGWTNVPESFSPAMEQRLTVANDAFEEGVNVDRFFDLYIYDSTDDGTTNYDRTMVVAAPVEGGAAGTPEAGATPVAGAKDGSTAVAGLEAGDWADIKVQLLGSRAGQTAGFHLKAIEIAPDLSQFRVYYTSIARANASYTGCTYAPDCAGPTGFAETLAQDFPSPTAADFAPLEARLIDEATYSEQGLLWGETHQAYLTYIIEELGVEPDLLLLGAPTTDEFSHQFLGLTTETEPDGTPNPFYDDLEGDGTPDGLLEQREGYIRSAYEQSDATLANALDLIEGDENVVVTSDHGFAPAYYAVNAGLVLQQAGVVDQEQIGNCRVPDQPAPEGDATPVPVDPEAPPTWPIAKACWAGGTAQIYLNVIDRDPAGAVDPDDYEALRDQIVAAFEGLTDPAFNNRPVVAGVFRKEDLRNIDGTDALHPSRSGDVVVTLNPPYQFDAATPGSAIAPSQFFGQHGYMPDLVDLEHDINLHATFLAGGPGFAGGTTATGVQAIDIAPTLSFLLGIPGPQNARGQIRYDVLAGGDGLTEVAILDISDFHGQIIPLSAATDSFDDEESAAPSFGVGGAAYLKPWFDTYRAAAPGLVLTVTAGDDIGATPPISAFFDDTPTIELLNLMGFSAGGLGNHNFDKGHEFMVDQIAPLAEYPYLSANLADESGAMPDAWQPSATFEVDGVTLAIVGFSNPDIPNLVFPGALGPYQVGDPTAAVNAEAERLRGEGVDAVVAMGHMGATAGDLLNPTGPVVDLADGVTGVDVVLGDHTDMQVLTTRPNGVLLTENASKGVQFTRVRVVIDTASGEVVYKTADFHRPWITGITPDPDIQARLDELNAETAPILEAPIGASTVAIPRADSCGTDNGRTCESLIGNVVADAMRTTYGTDFAITNSGGLRADLTCPLDDSPDDFCPAELPQNGITRGQVLGVLPFGNVVSTVEITGAELKTYLETGVAAMPEVAGGFPQVSGLCFTYDITLPAGERVTSVVRQGDDGACTTEEIDLSESATYMLATNDFTAAGGDGYPDVSARATTRDVLEEVVADSIAAAGTVSPSIQGRINCTGEGCPTIIQ